MKKNLIALAVLAASGVASAQSSLNIYGIADVAFASAGGTNVTRQTLIYSGGVSANRFGFKGTEDLGGGFKANFVLEQGFSIDNGAAGTVDKFDPAKVTATNPTGAVATTASFSRQAYVGFSTPYGEVRLGKTYTPFDDINGATAPGFDSVLSPYSNVWVSNSKYAANPANTIYYASPSFSGVSAAVSYSLGENKNTRLDFAGNPTTNGTTGVGSFNVQYAGGPVYVGLAYQAQKLAPTAGKSEKFLRLNGSYDLGVVKLLAGFGRATEVTPGLQTKEWQLGVDFPVNSALTLSGGFAGSKDNDAADTKRTGFGLAANYALSKRTSVYGGVQTTKTTVNATPDAKTDLYAVGVRHTF